MNPRKFKRSIKQVKTKETKLSMNKCLATRNTPVPVEEFADMCSDRIKSLSPDFYTEGKVREGFVQYGSAYNHCCELNNTEQSIPIIIPAATGSGKTVSSRLAMANIAKLGMSGLLVVSEISVALEAVADINKLAGKKVAGVYYTISKDHSMTDLWCSLKDLPQIAIISHALFISRSDTGKDIDLIRNYNNKQRDLIIIDERIDVVKRESFSTNEIPKATATLRRDKRLWNTADAIDEFSKEMFESKNFLDHRKDDNQIKSLFNNFSSSILQTRYLLLSGQCDIGLNGVRGVKKGQGEEVEVISNLFNRISWVISGRFTRIKEGSRIICHREEDLSYKFGSVVTLDATAGVNADYRYRDLNKHKMVFMKRIQSRNYSNVNLHICDAKGARQSKSAIYDEPYREKKLSEMATNYLRIVEEIVEPGDKMLAVSYKDMMPSFGELNPNNGKSKKPLVRFAHWGSKSVRGSNEFSTFNKAIAIGWLRRPQHYYTSSVMAVNDVDEYVPCTGSIWSDANYLKDMLIIDDLVQFLNRVQCRVSIDEEGNCKPTDLYIFTGGKKSMKDLIVKFAKMEMPGIKILNWELKAAIKLKRKKTALQTRIDAVVEFLRGKIVTHREITMKEIKFHFGFSYDQQKRLITSELFKETLEDENIFMLRTKTRGNPVTFLLPPNPV